MPGKIRVLYFAQARDAAGRSTEVVSLEGLTTARGVLDAVVEIHPRLLPLKPSLRLAVNRELGAEDARLNDGDEVAILPPVAGG